MKTNTFAKRFCAIFLAIFIQALLFAQTQYDYYDDDAVAGGADRALNGIIIIAVLVIAAIVLLFVAGGILNVYYWFNPKADPKNKQKLTTKGKTLEAHNRTIDYATIASNKDSNNDNDEGKSGDDSETQNKPLPQKELNSPKHVNVPEQKRTITESYNFEAIDLGLSVKWANRNVGSDKKNPYGKYYIWGEVEIPDHYESSIRLERTKGGGFRQLDNYYYRLDGKNEGELKKVLSGATTISGNKEYDVATKLLGKEWRIPTLEEACELHEKCEWDICEKEGVKGCLITGPNGNSIFLPLTGNFIDNNNVEFKNVMGYYWLADPCKNHVGFAHSLICCSKKQPDSPYYKYLNYNELSSTRRCDSLSIRPVFNDTENPKTIKEGKAIISKREYKQPTQDSSHEILSTKKIEEDYLGSLKDEYDVRYSSDGKKLMDVEDFMGNSNINHVSSYKINEGTLIIVDNAFASCRTLKRIIIPNTLKSIGNFSFSSCTSLTHINIPNSVNMIGDNPFLNCKNLKITCDSHRFIVTENILFDDVEHRLISYFGKDLEFSIPEHIKIIGNNAFAGNETLQKIIIPNSVTKIGKSAFFLLQSLKSIIVPDSVTRIEDQAFSECYSLQSIQLPESLSRIASGVFCGCHSLKSIIIPERVLAIENSAFYECSSLQNLIIPNSVIKIGDDAFSRCRSLQSINIPNYVKSIGKNPFCRCHKLTIQSQSSRFVIEDDVLYDNKEHRLISLLSEKQSFTIPNTVVSIGSSSFEGFASLQEIIFPDSLFEIGTSAFEYCGSLKSVKIPNSVRYIGESAFSNCYSLQNITLSESITSIEPFTFSNCSSLQSIIIPSSVTKIGNNAFFICSSLEYITIPNSVDQIEDAFDLNSNLQKIIIPQGSMPKFKKLLDSYKELLIEQ